MEFVSGNHTELQSLFAKWSSGDNDMEKKYFQLMDLNPRKKTIKLGQQSHSEEVFKCSCLYHLLSLESNRQSSLYL